MQAEERRKAQAEENVAGSASKAEAQTYLEGLASRNQIFNVKEAYAMLTRELSDMMKDAVRHADVSHVHARRVATTVQEPLHCSPSAPGKQCNSSSHPLHV